MAIKPININELGTQLSNGDLNAYKELFKSYYAPLTGFANTILNRLDQAEDVVSDFFLDLWIKRDQIVFVEDIKNYFYKAIRNRCINIIQREKKWELLVDEDPVIEEYSVTLSNPEKNILHAEFSAHINEIINKLPLRCRSCFYLVKEEGLSYKDAAAVLGISPRTVNAQLVIALKFLQQEIKKY